MRLHSNSSHSNYLYICRIKQLKMRYDTWICNNSIGPSKRRLVVVVMMSTTCHHSHGVAMLLHPRSSAAQHTLNKWLLELALAAGTVTIPPVPFSNVSWWRWCQANANLLGISGFIICRLGGMLYDISGTGSATVSVTIHEQGPEY